MLPTKEEREKYVKDYNLYLWLKENGIATTFYVQNIGTAKATDVSVRIIFPECIRVFKINEIIRISKPKAPERPENPIQRAYMQIEKARKLPWEIEPQEVSRKSSINYLAEALANRLEPAVIEMIEIENNVVELEDRQGVVHTKVEGFSGAYIIPVSAGNYEAKAIIMCAEYDSPEEKTIQFVVEE